ncbi:hypothetical protein JXX19_00525 [Ruthenibacterium lactatiformans]|nr:hypothetical protein [Ruthenibacterium lactatiformans]MBN3024903.1 hypothetical protein [Ruthenibacterium lactatiformans]
MNKLFAMAMQHVKQLAFPKVIYNRNLMAGRKWNNRVGEAIGVNGDPNVAVATGFRAPDMSAQVLVMIDKVIEYTRDTMGASDAALGNVTPDNTSAIIAVQKATSMPLELQRQDFYCFVEDSVRIWMDMMAQNYGVRMVRMKAPEAEAEAVPALPDSMGAGMLPQAAGGAPGMAGAMLQQAVPGPASGIPVLRSKMEGDLSPAREDAYETAPFNFSQLKGMNLRLNVEVGAATYWSELMQVQTLDNLFAKTYLVYDGETVQPASAVATVPKITIAKAPNGKSGATSYLPVNLLTGKRTDSYRGTEETKVETVYYLSFNALTDTAVTAQVLQADGSWAAKAEGTDFTVDRPLGKVTFKTAPGKSPVDGEDNVQITYEVADRADTINKCRLHGRYVHTFRCHLRKPCMRYVAIK